MSQKIIYMHTCVIHVAASGDDSLGRQCGCTRSCKCCTGWTLGAEKRSHYGLKGELSCGAFMPVHHPKTDVILTSLLGRSLLLLANLFLTCYF